jgi:hypothetical protein
LDSTSRRTQPSERDEDLMTGIVKREAEALRLEAAASAPRRVVHGVELSTPGDRPDWDDES